MARKRPDRRINKERCLAASRGSARNFRGACCTRHGQFTKSNTITGDNCASTSKRERPAGNVYTGKLLSGRTCYRNRCNLWNGTWLSVIRVRLTCPVDEAVSIKLREGTRAPLVEYFFRGITQICNFAKFEDSKLYDCQVVQFQIVSSSFSDDTKNAYNCNYSLFFFFFLGVITVL